MTRSGKKSRAEREFPHARSYCDRHGVRRWRVRKGTTSIDLGTDYGADVFRARYTDALERFGLIKKTSGQPSKTKPTTVADFVAVYRATPGFRSLASSTRRTYEVQMRKFEAERGSLPFRMMQRTHLIVYLDTIENPGASNAMLRMIKRLFNVIASRDATVVNIALGIEDRDVDKSFPCWEEPEIQRFFGADGIGKVARLAAMLALHTGAARTDLVKLGWHNLYVGEEGELRLRYCRDKTSTFADMPVHHELADLLATLSRKTTTFLEVRGGRRRSANGLGNVIRKAVKKAGLPCISLHGLRKALGRRIVEAGGTAHEVMAVLGHESLNEAERYTRTYARKASATVAMRKVQARGFTTQTKQHVEDVLMRSREE